LRRSDKNQAGATRPSLLSPAQQAEADRNRILTNLEGGPGAGGKPGRRAGRRMALWAGTGIGVLAVVAAAVWTSSNNTAGWGATGLDSNATLANSRTADASLPETPASPLAATIHDEPVPASGTGAHGPASLGGNALGTALETPSAATAPAPAKPARVSQARPDGKTGKTKTAPKAAPSAVGKLEAKPKSKPEVDSDVTLLAALMTHAPAKPEERKIAVSTKTQLQACKQMNVSSLEQCLMRVCATLGKGEAECRAAEKVPHK
jgi:hypothetical protein